MGKKGKKKKEKLTGTPDVQKFKVTREFFLLKECVSIQESLPFVASDILDDFASKKVARFLNMVGLLNVFLKVEGTKDYRFFYHHQFLAPTPQFFPNGYDAEIIKGARKIMERPIDIYNQKEYVFPEELKTLSDKFLKDVDSEMTKIASFIEPSLKDDFNAGLKKFKWDFKDMLTLFDKRWVEFEREFVKARHDIHTQVFAPVEKLVTIESQLTTAEDKLDIESKQELENDFVDALQEFIHQLFPEYQSTTFPANSIQLAEACIFYETKCTDEWLNLAKYLIKDYLEVRIYVANIPQARLSPHHKENTNFMRLLKNFHGSVHDATEALDFVSKLPKLIHAKTGTWMTRKLLEPDLQLFHKGSNPQSAYLPSK